MTLPLIDETLNRIRNNAENIALARTLGQSVISFANHASGAPNSLKDALDNLNKLDKELESVAGVAYDIYEQSMQVNIAKTEALNSFKATEEKSIEALEATEDYVAASILEAARIILSKESQDHVNHFKDLISR